MFQINSLKDRLDSLRKVIDDEFPGNSHLVYSSDGITMDKLKGANIMTGTYTAAQKV